MPTVTLPWGTESSRLCSSSVLAVEHSGKQPEKTSIPEPLTYVSHKVILLAHHIEWTPSWQKKFVRRLAETPDWQNLLSRQSSIRLSHRETSVLHAICKYRKVTVTALLNSLCILADVQTALHFPGNNDLKSVHKDFYDADVYIVESNLADRVCDCHIFPILLSH